MISVSGACACVHAYEASRATAREVFGYTNAQDRKLRRGGSVGRAMPRRGGGGGGGFLVGLEAELGRLVGAKYDRRGPEGIGSTPKKRKRPFRRFQSGANGTRSFESDT